MVGLLWLIGPALAETAVVNLAGKESAVYFGAGIANPAKLTATCAVDTPEVASLSENEFMGPVISGTIVAEIVWPPLHPTLTLPFSGPPSSGSAPNAPTPTPLPSVTMHTLCNRSASPLGARACH